MVFLHKILPGPADKSYGIHVAKLAGLPESLLKRAQIILEDLEKTSAQKPAQPVEKTKDTTNKVAADKPYVKGQLSLFKEPETSPNQVLLQQLKDANLMKMTPLDAMNLLAHLQDELVD